MKRLGKFSCYCKKCTIEKSRARQKNNQEEISLYLKNYREENKQKIAKTVKEYADKNKSVIKKYKSDWYFVTSKPDRIKNRILLNKKQREYRVNRIKSDPIFKIASTCRIRILSALKTNQISKSSSTTKLIGCTISEYVDHLEKQFKPGMTWGNHGLHGWHIDHIKPVCMFDLTDPEQQKICFNYKNTQPLWAEDNWSKGSKIL